VGQEEQLLGRAEARRGARREVDRVARSISTTIVGVPAACPVAIPRVLMCSATVRPLVTLPMIA
jgi:hypothetical protein